MRVIKSRILPVPETYPASDLETREEIKIASGRQIHAINVEGSLIVSEELWNELAKKAKGINFEV